MKRRALLIGNSNGLVGVKKDIKDFKEFLTGSLGGEWYNREITVLMNTSLDTLNKEIDSIKDLQYDYVIVMYSGHGGYVHNTILEINGSETIPVTNLLNLAPRQLSIFDCCRVVCQEAITESLHKSYRFSAYTSPVRCAYEKRIMESIPQQCILYACKINECAYDSSEGAYYLQNLITYAKRNTNRYSTVGQIHELAAHKTEIQALMYQKRSQHPDAILPKCLTNQQLILCLNPQLVTN